MSARFVNSAKVRSLLASVAIVAVVLTMQNCDNVHVSMQVTKPQAVAPASVVPADLFGKLEPVLATRNPACISCHGQVNGDFITDFGLGDPFVMGTDAATNHPLQKTYYGPFASKHFVWDGGTWDTMSIMGNVYVPDAQITDPRLIASYAAGGNAPLAAPLKILDFVKGNFMDPTVSTTAPTTLMNSTTSPDIDVPGLRGQFYSRKTIWIDSPRADEIRDLELADGAKLVLVKPGVVIYKNSAMDQFSGLSALQSAKTFRLFLTNATGPVVCKGDIIIEGTVFLNNLVLDTDDQGCRIYASSTVFIQGPITYVNGGNSNLQITSSRAIILGMHSLNTRLTQLGTDAAVSGVRAAYTDDQEVTGNLPIINDRDDVNGLTNDAGPFQLMVDQGGNVVAIQDDFDDGIWRPVPGNTTFPNPASCVNAPTAGSAPCAIDWTAEFPVGAAYKRSISYQHLFLNAPRVYSRYWGAFQGVIIGEDVLFAVQHFVFQKDPVMLQVPLLPLLQNRVFSMSDD